LTRCRRREPGSRLVVVGRLTPAKHVEDTIAALEVIAGRRPDAHLDIVGSGDPVYRRRLETLARGRGVLGRLTFHGRVSEDEKRRLLGRADLHLFASRREGWGLTVTEAAVLGTPTVGYDAPGVRDSVADPRCLAPRGDSDALARRALDLLGDEKLYATIRTEAWNRGRALTYERATRAFADAVGVPLD
jgi:glycosyltransferase involved in cell wall biosynthesis